ncbi:MAG: hypothetical protein GX198_02415 [Epulopiscium sp.]|nr:hypothetical protein [Candidatus Epulonipiscium sp.]
MKKTSSILWIFILGFIGGMMSNHMLYMHELEKSLNENEILSTKLADSLIKLNQLENNDFKKEKLILKDIVPVNTNKDEPVIPKNEIEQYIKLLLNNQIGKEVKNIDIHLIYNALNNRILKYQDGNYQLKIRAILVSEMMHIYYSVEKIQI